MRTRPPGRCGGAPDRATRRIPVQTGTWPDRPSWRPRRSPSSAPTPGIAAIRRLATFCRCHTPIAADRVDLGVQGVHPRARAVSMSWRQPLGSRTVSHVAIHPCAPRGITSPYSVSDLRRRSGRMRNFTVAGIRLQRQELAAPRILTATVLTPGCSSRPSCTSIVAVTNGRTIFAGNSGRRGAAQQTVRPVLRAVAGLHVDARRRFPVLHELRPCQPQAELARLHLELGCQAGIPVWPGSDDGRALSAPRRLRGKTLRLPALHYDAVGPRGPLRDPAVPGIRK